MKRAPKRGAKPSVIAAPQRAAIDAYPCAVAWTGQGDLLAIGCDDGTVALYSPAGRCEQRFAAHAGPITALAWHPARCTLVTCGQDGAARLWEMPFARRQELLAPSAAWAEHACFSPAGDRIAVAAGEVAHVFAAGTIQVTTEPAGSTIAAIAFSPSGKSLGVARYGGVQLFDPATGRPTRSLAWKGSMLSIAFSPDGGTVACGCQDHTVHFWRIASGKDAQMHGYPAKPRSVAFNHDGAWLATGGDRAVQLWPFGGRGPEGRAAVQLAAQPDVVTEVAYAPLVEILLSGARDGTVALWSPPDHALPLASWQLAGKVAGLAWGADPGAGVLRWAAAGASGELLLGSL